SAALPTMCASASGLRGRSGNAANATKSTLPTSSDMNRDEIPHRGEPLTAPCQSAMLLPGPGGAQNAIGSIAASRDRRVVWRRGGGMAVQRTRATVGKDPDDRLSGGGCVSFQPVDGCFCRPHARTGLDRESKCRDRVSLVAGPYRALRR